MSQADTPQPGYDPKQGETAPSDPKDRKGSPQPAIPQEDDPEIEKTEEQPS